MELRLEHGWRRRWRRWWRGFSGGCKNKQNISSSEGVKIQNNGLVIQAIICVTVMGLVG